MKQSKLKLYVLFFLFSIFVVIPAASVIAETVHAEYYGELGCAHCDDFTEKTLPEAEMKSGVTVDLDLFDVLSAEGYEQCELRLNKMGYEFSIFPVLIIGNNAYQGNSAIEENLVEELSYYAEKGDFRPKQQKASILPGKNGVSLSLIPIFFAGLVDGINPCAFATLLFFVSFINLRGRNKKETLYFGLTFAAGIFIAYFLIGLGLFNLLRLAIDFTMFRLILNIIVTCITATFCILSIRDFYLIKQGKTSNIFLQLPESMKKRIHLVIRSGMSSAALGIGIFGIGIFVAILELACTGQIYFPTISFMVQTDITWLGIGSLILYNTAFIIPLLVVLFTVYFGMRHKTISSFFSRHMGFTKIALALVFAALAVLVWVF